MLSPSTPFPLPGSYGLFVDPGLPPGQAGAELARIIRASGDGYLISLPNRRDATGNRTADAGDLRDGTELDSAERRELADLDRLLRDKARPRGKRADRRKALRERAIWSDYLRRLIEAHERRQRARAA
jgi:hypothetical protein